MLMRRTNKNFLKMCGGKINSEYLYINIKTMSKEMRKHIDTFKERMLNEQVELKSFYTPLYGREEKLIVNKRENMVDLVIVSGEEKLKITVNLDDLKRVLR